MCRESLEGKGCIFRTCIFSQVRSVWKLWSALCNLGFFFRSCISILRHWKEWGVQLGHQCLGRWSISRSKKVTRSRKVSRFWCLAPWRWKWWWLHQPLERCGLSRWRRRWSWREMICWWTLSVTKSKVYQRWRVIEGFLLFSLYIEELVFYGCVCSRIVTVVWANFTDKFVCRRNKSEKSL